MKSCVVMGESERSVGIEMDGPNDSYWNPKTGWYSKVTFEIF